MVVRLPTEPCPGRESNPQPPGFKPGRSSDWRTWACQWSRMELNHRFLGVGQVSWPLDHGAVPVAEAVGVEPTSDTFAAACLPSRFLNHSDGFRIEAAGAGLEPT